MVGEALLYYSFGHNVVDVEGNHVSCLSQERKGASAVMEVSRILGIEFQYGHDDQYPMTVRIIHSKSSLVASTLASSIMIALLRLHSLELFPAYWHWEWV
jgi:hypothetical protein